MDFKGRLYFRWLGAWAARWSRLIITVSDKAKRDIVSALRIADRKVRVVYEGVDDAFSKVTDDALMNSVRARYGLPEHFILTVGTLEPRKNLPALLQAYRRMRRTIGTKLGLVIVGRTGWKSERQEHEARDESEQIVRTGFVPQRDLVALYNLADVFVLPSLYEGFGFTPLEAMACGCPAIVSNRGSLPEVVGDAALLIDPESEDSIVSALCAVESNQLFRSSLATRGLERVKKFSWSTAASRTLAIYREIGGAVLR
jgi:glycosyltransferase involved in cell wall biosynthesis